MKTLKFSSLRDDNTQHVSRDGIKLATIWYDFDTIVFEHETKSISIQEVIEISQAVKANSALIPE